MYLFATQKKYIYIPSEDIKLVFQLISDCEHCL